MRSAGFISYQQDMKSPVKRRKTLQMVTDNVPHAGRPPQSCACIPGSALLEGRDERRASHFSGALAVLSYTVLVMGIVVSIWAVTSWP